MYRSIWLLGVMAMGSWARPALAWTLETRDGTSYTGVVKGLDEEGLTFLWRRSGEMTLKEVSEDELAVTSEEVREVDVPMDKVARIDGVPVERYPAMFKDNLYYRLLNSVERAYLEASSGGTVAGQALRLAFMLAFFFLAVPLALVLLSWLLPGEPLHFGGAFGTGLFLCGAGIAGAYLSRFLTARLTFTGSPGAQIGISSCLALVTVLVLVAASRQGLLRSVLFTAVWGLGVFLLQRILGTLPA